MPAVVFGGSSCSARLRRCLLATVNDINRTTAAPAEVADSPTDRRRRAAAVVPLARTVWRARAEALAARPRALAARPAAPAEARAPRRRARVARVPAVRAAPRAGAVPRARVAAGWAARAERRAAVARVAGALLAQAAPRARAAALVQAATRARVATRARAAAQAPAVVRAGAVAAASRVTRRTTSARSGPAAFRWAARRRSACPMAPSRARAAASMDCRATPGSPATAAGVFRADRCAAPLPTRGEGPDRARGYFLPWPWPCSSFFSSLRSAFSAIF